MTLLGFLKTTLIVVLVLAILVPIYVAESSLHSLNHAAPNTNNAAYLARTIGATWQPASITAADGAHLHAWYFQPPADPNGAAVLLLHGIDDTRLGMTGHLPYLIYNGYSVLMPDSRADGSSGGSLVTYGIKEAPDAALWAQWMTRQPGVTRTYALGESLGAAVAIESLADRPGFRAIVAECPFSTFEAVAEYRVAQKSLRVLASPVVKLGMIYAKLRYGLDLNQASPLNAIRATTTPVLLIHGTEDVKIPPQESRDLHAANPQATELWEVDGASHTHAILADPVEYRRRVLAWFAGH